MANIYQQVSSDKTLILAPREAFQRKFDVGSWNEIRLGIFFNSAGSSTPTSSYVDEILNQNTRSDIIAFGLKDSATSILPGFSGSYFLGASITGSESMAANNTQYYNNSITNLYGTGFYGTSASFGSSNLSQLRYPNGGGANSSTDYCGFYVLKMVLNNSGSSTQTVTMTTSATQQVSSGTSFYSIPQLNQLMNNATFGSNSTVTWNDGVNAYPIPDSIWIRTPYYFNTIRISSLSLIKYS